MFLNFSEIHYVYVTKTEKKKTAPILQPTIVASKESARISQITLCGLRQFEDLLVTGGSYGRNDVFLYNSVKKFSFFCSHVFLDYVDETIDVLDLSCSGNKRNYTFRKI
jgi:hypothetical protein